MITNRHIRHDWQTWVNWEQASVKTLCGIKSQPRLCGIPGIGRPDETDKWCARCINSLVKGRPWKNPPLKEILKAADSADISIQLLYHRLLTDIGPQITS